MRGDTGQIGQIRVRATTLVGIPVPTTEPQPVVSRRTTPIVLRLEAHFRNDMQFVREYAANLSLGGILVQTHLRPQFDAEAILVVRLPNGDILSTPATVVRIVDQPPPGGVCLSFARREPAFEAALRCYFLGLGGRSS